MKFDIEVYKGQTIQYDDEYDKFICDISIEDKFKTTKRGSLNDVRKEIDQFVKINLDFKPFKALYLDKYDADSFVIKHITGIRTDGKFIVKEGTYGSHYGKKEIKQLMQYDQEIVDQADILKAKKDQAIKEYSLAMKELCKKLKPIDISKYESIINQE